MQAELRPRCFRIFVYGIMLLSRDSEGFSLKTEERKLYHTLSIEKLHYDADDVEQACILC